jgi:hypothetical protein
MKKLLLSKMFKFTFEYLRKFEIGPPPPPGAWGKLIHEKNLKSKISCQTSFKFRFTEPWPFNCK